MIKKVMYLMLCTAVLACFVCVRAEEGSVPENVSAFAQGALCEVKAELKRGEGVEVDRLELTEAGIDSLELGAAYPVHHLWYVTDSAYEVLPPADTWLFFLDSGDKPLVCFTVTHEEDGNLRRSIPRRAGDVALAIKVMERLGRKERVTDAPLIFGTASGFLLVQSFNGDERVITVPGGVVGFERAYGRVRSIKQLPTYKELADKLRESAVRLDDDLDSLNYITRNDPWLAPKVGPSVWPVVAVGAGAALVICTAAFVLNKRNRMGD